MCNLGRPSRVDVTHWSQQVQNFDSRPATPVTIIEQAPTFPQPRELDHEARLLWCCCATICANLDSSWVASVTPVSICANTQESYCAARGGCECMPEVVPTQIRSSWNVCMQCRFLQASQLHNSSGMLVSVGYGHGSLAGLCSQEPNKAGVCSRNTYVHE